MAQTKASSALLLSLHDRSRGQGQGMMSKSDPSVTCYWYDKTRDTLVSLLEVHSPNWSLELQWKCLCPCNLHLIDPKGSGDGRADAKSHAKWTFTRSLSSFCSVSYISYLRSNYNTTASFGGALMQEEKTWPHSSLSLQHSTVGPKPIGNFALFCTKKGTKGALKARAAKPLWPSSSFYRRPYYRLTIAPFKSTFLLGKVREKRRIHCDTEEWHDLYCDQYKRAKECNWLLPSLLLCQGKYVTSVTHIFHLKSRTFGSWGEEPKKVPLRIRIIAVTML